MFVGYLEYLYLKGDRVVFIYVFDLLLMQLVKYSEYYEMVIN